MTDSDTTQRVRFEMEVMGPEQLALFEQACVGAVLP
jgi:hypothetical protein